MACVFISSVLIAHPNQNKNKEVNQPVDDSQHSITTHSKALNILSASNNTITTVGDSQIYVVEGTITNLIDSSSNTNNIVVVSREKNSDESTEVEKKTQIAQKPKTKATKKQEPNKKELAVQSMVKPFTGQNQSYQLNFSQGVAVISTTFTDFNKLVKAKSSIYQSTSRETTIAFAHNTIFGNYISPKLTNPSVTTHPNRPPPVSLRGFS